PPKNGSRTEAGQRRADGDRQAEARHGQAGQRLLPVAGFEGMRVAAPGGDEKVGGRLRTRDGAEQRGEALVVGQWAHGAPFVTDRSGVESGASASAIARRRSFRPRWSQVMTVPIGTARTAAMSR